MAAVRNASFARSEGGSAAGPDAGRVGCIEELDRPRHRPFIPSRLIFEGILKQARPVNKRDNDNLALRFEHLIKHSVGPKDKEFAETGIVLFWHYSATLRKLTQ